MKTSWGLALGGWWARGFAHIGVYQYLLKKNIYISEVSGTSMGGVVAAGIACGLSPKKMSMFAKEVKLFRMLDFNFRTGVISGKKVYKSLEKVFWERTFKDTVIPLKVVACDFQSGEKHVFSSGKIIHALRASISVPGIFSACIHKQFSDTEYVDGGLVSILPAEILEETNIIAISVIRGVKNIPFSKNKRTIFWKIPNIFERSLATCWKQLEAYSILQAKVMGKRIEYVELDGENIGYAHFWKSESLIAYGFKKMKTYCDTNNIT